MYERINCNSFAQFMRTRVRYLHISKRILVGTTPEGTIVRRLATKGETFRHAQPRRYPRIGATRRENLRRIRALRGHKQELPPVTQRPGGVGMISKLERMLSLK